MMFKEIADADSPPFHSHVHGAVFCPSDGRAGLCCRSPSAAQMRAWDKQVTPAGYDPATTNPWGFHPRFLPQRVEANDGLTVGDIHVDAVARYLYHIEEGGTAMRYGVAIARGNLYEPGVYTIRRKIKWPNWTPTPAMIKRDPGTYEQWADGMPPGRAMRWVHGRFICFRATATPICASMARLIRARSAGGRVRAACGW
ncbi:MAG: hypothetical protein EpisKO_37960 [Epibacterium sp.]